ncbi:MIP family channel protein [Lentilactobacillus kribbianus]|uniref:MIP family channel protein n=1 Tax=Lentilactobacillus kribbianus TaxID=2729622 RepID=UPI001553831A
MVNGFTGEFLGTMVLILFGTATSAGINLKKTYGSQGDWLYVSLAWGIAVTMGVYVAAMFGTQGHLNPAVTIAYALFGLFPWGQVLPYIIGQFLGAMVGAAVAAFMFIPQFKATTSQEGNGVGIFATRPAIYAPFYNFMSEVIATFAFIFVLLNLGDFTTGLKPLIVGLVITVVGIGLGTTTGFALNPARDWGPRLVYTLLPLPNKQSSAEWNYAWIPMCGPIVGAILATGLEALLK